MAPQEAFEAEPSSPRKRGCFVAKKRLPTRRDVFPA